MPLFEFKCLKCGKEFEDLILNPRDAKKMTCPKCGSKDLEKKVSLFATNSGEQCSCGGSCKPSGGG